MLATLKKELSAKINPVLVEELLKEYTEVLDGFYRNDNPKLLSASGRFVEMVLATISYLNDGRINLNNIEVDKLYKKIINLPKNTGEEELLYLEIPRTARAIYTIRSKKRGPHKKDLDPILQDRDFIKSATDWILASLLFLYHTKSEKEISCILENLIEKKIPLIEEFEDGGVLILKKLSFSQKLLVLLYVQKGMITKDVLRTLSKPKYAQEFNINLLNLERRLLVYINANNIKITKNGIREVDTTIFKPE